MATTELNPAVMRLATTMLNTNISLAEVRDAMFVVASRRTKNTTECANMLGISMKGAYNIRTDLTNRKLFNKHIIGSNLQNDGTIELNTKRLL